MARKKLEGEDLRKFEKMVLAGKTPEDIKEVFGIAVSSVHNYKRTLKKRGFDVPDVRGKRPSEVTPQVVTPLFSKVNGGDPRDKLEFVVNNVTISVSNRAKTVNVEGNKITIEI